MKHHHKKINNSSGFSMPELIVVIAIFGIMSGVTVFKHNDFRSDISANAVAHDIGVSIRQAQVYGISASERNIGGSGFDENDDNIDDILIGGIINDRSIRGVSINISENFFYLFEDGDRDGVFDDEPTDRIIDRREILDPLVHIEKVCFGVGVDLDSCTGVTDGKLDVTFERPFPDATIKHSGTDYSFAGIVVGTGQQTGPLDRYIEIWSSGNIIVR